MGLNCFDVRYGFYLRALPKKGRVEMRGLRESDRVGDSLSAVGKRVKVSNLFRLRDEVQKSGGAGRPSPRHHFLGLAGERKTSCML